MAGSSDAALAAGCFCAERGGDLACRDTGSSVTGCANGSVLHHGDCEWRDLPYRRRPGAETFSTGNRARRRPAEYAAAWPLFPGKPAGLKPYRHSASDHHQRDADFHRSGRHRFLDAATTRAVSERIVSRLMIF